MRGGRGGVEALHRHEVVEGWLRKNVASFFLMFWDEDALGYFVVGCCADDGTVVKFGYAYKSVFGHLIRGNEYRLCLGFTPCVKAFVVEIFSFDVTTCVYVGNIAVDYAVFGYGDF